jgi:cytochrome bd-type quinol oxidase subunit 2
VVASRGIPDPLAWLRWVIIAIVVIALLALILANPSKRAVKRGLKHEARDLRYSVAALIAPVVFVMGVLVALELIASSAAQGAPWWAFGIGGLAVAAVFYPLGRWNWRILGKPRDPEV